MAKILAVHGIGQQFKGDAVIHAEWWPALSSGVRLAGGDLRDGNDLACAFYGHLFRRPGSLAASPAYTARDVGAEEESLLEALWIAAADAEPDRVPPPGAYAAGTTLARTPQFVTRALNALSRSRFFANVSQRLLIGDLKQVVRYMGEPAVREAVLQTVLDLLTEETRVVVGHSLGAVVAYEALCRKPMNVVSFVTLGSPLGIRNLIFDRLQPAPQAGVGCWPGRVAHWTNIADAGDIVAVQRLLAPLFGGRVKDVLVHNGSDAHHGERYFTTAEAGAAIRAGL